jgi:hypothetical protein
VLDEEISKSNASGLPGKRLSYQKRPALLGSGTGTAKVTLDTATSSLRRAKQSTSPSAQRIALRTPATNWVF